MTLVERAVEFAHKAHEGQVRKYTGDPYIVHPLAVMELVRTVPHTDEMLAAAVLHDTVEDTSATFDEIRERFGVLVGVYVFYLTDVSRPEDGNRAIRKAMDRDHISSGPAAVHTIKIADMIDNASSIKEHDPKFYRVFAKEKADLLEVLSLGDPALMKLAVELKGE